MTAVPLPITLRSATPILAVVVPRRGIVRWASSRTVEPMQGSHADIAYGFLLGVDRAIGRLGDGPRQRRAEAGAVLQAFPGSYAVVVVPGEPLTIPPEIAEPLPAPPPDRHRAVLVRRRPRKAARGPTAPRSRCE